MRLARIASASLATAWLLGLFASNPSCSIFNREGPAATCADLDDGNANDCADGIIVRCLDGAIQYEVCEDEGACDQPWQSPGHYSCTDASGSGGGPSCVDDEVRCNDGSNVDPCTMGLDLWYSCKSTCDSGSICAQTDCSTEELDELEACTQCPQSCDGFQTCVASIACVTLF